MGDLNMAFSFLNGLGSMGASVAQFAGSAGLELQKSQLATQAQILADRLATTRETGLQNTRLAAQSGEKALDRTAAREALDVTEGGANTRNAATIAGTAANNAATNAAAMARTQAEINKPTDLERIDRYLGFNPDGTLKSGGSAAPNTSGSAGTPSAKGSASGAETQTSDASEPSRAATPSSGLATTLQARRDKALGLPAQGSPEASRMAIAQGVARDHPYWTADQKATETELRVAVAEGKMTDPKFQESNAKAIAGYQMAPLDHFALTKAGGSETMARVTEINPDYQASRYPEVNKAMSAFGTGKQGDIVRANNVGVQHLGLIDEAAKALANNNVGAINTLKNAFQREFGAPAPTTFDGLKQIVGTEIEKAVAGGIGAVADRGRLMKALDGARSPAQLQAMTDGFRSLMIGQLRGLKTQYEEATGLKKGDFVFEKKLDPETLKMMQQSDSTSRAAPSDPGPAAREVGKSYTSPTSGKVGVWRGTGWELVQ